MRLLWPQQHHLDSAALAALYEHPGGTIRLNFVSSVDGAVTVDGHSKGLGSESDHTVFHLLRRFCDALMVGAGTLRNEQYGSVRMSAKGQSWRAARGLAPHPTLVVVSRRLDLDPSNPAFVDAPVKPIIVTHRSAPAGRMAALQPVATVLSCGDGDVDLAAAASTLRSRGFSRVLCEGGPHLLGSLTHANLVDELCLTFAPLLAGPGAGRITAGPPAVDNTIRPLRLAHLIKADDVLLSRYVRAE
jgi:riboflavin biosynthesis pyrimidine reductase